MRLFITILFAISACLATAQVDLSLRGGYAQAVGDYGSVNSSNENAMYALGGLNADLWAGYRVTDFVGVTAGVHIGANNVDDSQLAQSFGISSSQLVSDGIYTSVAFLGGVYFLFGEKVKVKGTIAGGLSGFDDADYTAVGQNRVQVYHYPRDGFGFFASGEVYFPLVHWFSIGPYFSYYTSSHDVPYEVYVNGQYYNETTYEASVSNVAFGVSFNFHIGAGGEE